MWLKIAADEYIEIKLKDEGTAVGGTDITPANLNTSSARKALGEFQYGADITGLSGGVSTMKIYHANTNESIYRNFNQDIVLGAKGTLTLYAETGTTEISGMLIINFHGTNN